MSPATMPRKPFVRVYKRYVGDVPVVLHPADTHEGRTQETDVARHLWWNRADWDSPTTPDMDEWNALAAELKDYWISRASVALDALRGPG